MRNILLLIFLIVCTQASAVTFRGHTLFTDSRSSATITSSGAFVEIQSSSGFLLPRLTTSQRNALLGTTSGLMVFNTDIGQLEILTSSQTWEATSTGTPLSSTDDLTEGSTNLYYTDARVSANSDVAANTSSRHEHANFALLEEINTSSLLSQGQIDDIGDIDANTSSRHGHLNILVLDGITTSSALSQNEKDALVGTNGVPSSTNLFVTTSDSRLSGTASSTATLQDSYEISNDPEITLGTTSFGFSIVDNATPLSGELFEIHNNIKTSTYFSVNSSTVFIGGALDNTAGATHSSTLFLRSIQLIASSTPSYSLRLPLADGSAGQILSTDGNGNLSFATDATGGGGGGGGGSGTSTALTILEVEVVREGDNPPFECAGVNDELDCFAFTQISDQDIKFESPVIETYTPGDDIRLELKGSATSTTDVRLILEVGLISDNDNAYADPFTNSTTVGATVTLPTSTGFVFTSTALVISSGGSIGGGSVAVDDVLVMRLTREASSLVDTSTGLLNIHQIRVDFAP